MAAVASFNIDFRANVQAFLKGTKDAQQTAVDFTRKLELQAAAFSLDSKEAVINKLAQEGASHATLAAAGALSRHISELEAQSSAMARGRQIAEQFVTPLEKLQRETADLADLLNRGAINQKTFTQAISRAKKEYHDAANAANKLSTRMEVLQGTLGAVGIAAGASSIVSFFKEQAFAGIEAAASMEQSRIQYELFMGSVEEGNAVLQQVRDFAKETPFQFPELDEAARRMLALGFSSEEMMHNLQMLGDIASGTNKPIGDFVGLIGELHAKGRLFTEDLRQWEERGIPLAQTLAEQMGLTTAEIRELITQGQIGEEEVTKALQSMTDEGGKFHDMLERNSQSLKGLWSTANDEFEGFRRSYFEGLLEATAATKLLKSALDGLGAVDSEAIGRAAGQAGGEKIAEQGIGLLFGGGGTGTVAGSFVNAGLSVWDRLRGATKEANKETDKNTSQTVDQLKKLNKHLENTTSLEAADLR